MPSRLLGTLKAVFSRKRKRNCTRTSSPETAPSKKDDTLTLQDSTRTYVIAAESMRRDASQESEVRQTEVNHTRSAMASVQSSIPDKVEVPSTLPPEIPPCDSASMFGIKGLNPWARCVSTTKSEHSKDPPFVDVHLDSEPRADWKYHAKRNVSTTIAYDLSSIAAADERRVVSLQGVSDDSAAAVSCPINAQELSQDLGEPTESTHPFSTGDFIALDCGDDTFSSLMPEDISHIHKHLAQRRLRTASAALRDTTLNDWSSYDGLYDVTEQDEDYHVSPTLIEIPEPGDREAAKSGLSRRSTLASLDVNSIPRNDVFGAKSSRYPRTFPDFLSTVRRKRRESAEDSKQVMQAVSCRSLHVTQGPGTKIKSHIQHFENQIKENLGQTSMLATSHPTHAAPPA